MWIKQAWFGLMEFRGICAKESKPFISFQPASLPFGYEIWCLLRVHVVCLYYLPHLFLTTHGWGPQVCNSALDNEIHMNAWCTIAMYICCAFDLIDWALMQRLAGDLRYALWFWLVECMCMLNTRRVYVIHVICFAQGLFDLWPICSHIPSSLLETKFRALRGAT